MLVRLETNIYKCKNISIWVISYLRDTKDLVFCYQNCSDLLREKIVLVMEKVFLHH